MITQEKVFIINLQGKVILVRPRNGYLDGPSKWEVPSIQLEYVTDSEQQVRSEILKELGIEVLKGNPFATSQSNISSSDGAGNQIKVDVFEIGRLYIDCSPELNSLNSVSEKYIKIELVKIDDLINYDFSADIKPMIKKLMEIYKEYLELQTRIRKGTKHNPIDQLFNKFEEMKVPKDENNQHQI